MSLLKLLRMRHAINSKTALVDRVTGPCDCDKLDHDQFEHCIKCEPEHHYVSVRGDVLKQLLETK